jgi:ADP-ribose pyrophosphatase
MEQRGPWKVIKKALKYQNPWMEVVEDEVIRPDGKGGIFGTVRIKDGISVLALDDEGYAYLTDEFHYALGRHSIEVVSGGIESHETPVEAAKRELQEELGIIAEHWTHLGNVHPFTTTVNSNAILFLAEKLTFTKPKPEGTEKISTIKVKFDHIVNKVHESEITHAQSCVLILKTDNLLKKRKQKETP